jgi:acyl-coenzyme A thioesterase PaaI-like protein
LPATAEPVKVGRNLGIVDARVTDEQGKLATGLFSTG